MGIQRAIRLVTTVALATSLVAVLLGRTAPQRPGFRYDPVAYLSIMDGYSAGAPPRVLDARTGRLSALPFPARHCLRWGSLSPWVDADGERFVIGWWTGPSMGGHSDAAPTGCGLASVSFPSGRLVDVLPEAPVPIGRPCWSPHSPRRLLYPAGDGRLYCVEILGIDVRSSASMTVQRIPWNQPADPVHEPFIEAICWPDHRVFDGRLLAAVRFPGAAWQGGRSRLCWLTLGPAGTEITKLERISVGHAPGETEPDVTCPSLELRPDGHCLVAFQRLSGKAEPYALWVASIDALELRNERVIPFAGMRLLADRVTRVPAAFSPDGAAVYAAVSSGGRGMVVQRFSLQPRERTPGRVKRSVAFASDALDRVR